MSQLCPKYFKQVNLNVLKNKPLSNISQSFQMSNVIKVFFRQIKLERVIALDFIP